MKITAKIKPIKKITAQIKELRMPLSDGYEEGYEQGYKNGEKEGYNKGVAAVEADNSKILNECNEVFPQKNVDKAETLGDVPKQIHKIKTYSEGYDVGYAEGEKAEYLNRWDLVLNPPIGYISWGYRFAGYSWNDATFNPPSDIVPAGNAYMMFAQCGVRDLEALCNKNGISLDFSKVTSFYYVFSDSKITHVGTIDTRGANNVKQILFNATNMVTVDKIILKSDGSQTFNNAFDGTSKLQNIAFEGVIGKSISFANSPLLSDASVQSIIDHLKDLTGQTTQTLTFHATVGGNLTAAQKADITAKNWTLVY